MISVITPTHNPIWLNDLYNSLLAQTYKDWEWIIVPNNGAVIPEFEDKRVKIVPLPIETNRIGALKRFACKHACGDYILEADHDDILVENCLEEVVKAFESDAALTMVHSNDAHVDMDFQPAQIWKNYFGWEYRKFNWHGHELLENISPEAIPQHISRIWFAPDHIRAWRTRDYWRIGGHDQSMSISDDHDFVIRNYLYGKIGHINKCLYIYRVHDNNTTFVVNQQIQETMWENYDKYIMELIGKWADDRGLLKVDLGGGLRPYQDYITTDLNNQAQINADLEQDWPWRDNSVGVFRAIDVVEHLHDPIHTMNEIWRCLAHGGFAIIDVPSTDGRGAFQDPTHCSYWNDNSYMYYTRVDMYEFIKHKAKCKFQGLRIQTVFPNENCRLLNIPYVQAHLIALKTDGRFHGYYDW